MGIVGLILGDGHPLNQPNGLFGVFHYSLLLLLSKFIPFCDYEKLLFHKLNLLLPSRFH